MPSFTRFCIELYKFTMNEIGTLEKRSATTSTRFSGSITINVICGFIQAHTFSIAFKYGLYASQFSLSTRSTPFSCIYFSTILAQCIEAFILQLWFTLRYTQTQPSERNGNLHSSEKTCLFDSAVVRALLSRHHFLRVLRCLVFSRGYLATARPLNPNFFSVLLMVIWRMALSLKRWYNTK